MIEGVILEGIFLEWKKGLLEGRDLVVMWDEVDEIGGWEYCEFGEEGVDDLYVGVVGGVED